MRYLLMIAALSLATPAFADPTIEALLVETNDVIVMETISGQCTYGVAREVKPCSEIRVSDDVEDGRLNFTVSTELGILNFSSGGNASAILSENLYTIDSLECCRADESVKHNASGQCAVTMWTADRVKSIRCEAETRWGMIHLEVNQPALDTDPNLVFQ
jgi:hypothetical protein